MIFTCLRFCKENLVIFFRSAIYCKPGVFKFFSSAWCVFLVPHLIENKWSSWNIGRTSISASSNSPIIASQVVANLTYKDTAHFCCSFLLQFVGMLFYHHLKNLMFTIHFIPAICPPWQKPPLDQSSHQVRVPSACAFHCGPSNRTPWKYYLRLHHFILYSEYLLVSFYLACLLKYINDLTEYLCVPKSMPKKSLKDLNTLIVIE